MKKLKKIIQVMAIVVIAILVLVPIINILLFHFSIPADISDAKWRGDWHSEIYPMVSGKFIADIPEPIPTSETFQVDTFVYYNLWSLFRPSGKLRTSLIGSIASGTNVNSDFQRRKPIQITFKFKGGPGTDSQVIDYVATSDSHWTIFVGGYRSTNPDDMGIFTLKKK